MKQGDAAAVQARQNKHASDRSRVLNIPPPVARFGLAYYARKQSAFHRAGFIHFLELTSFYVVSFGLQTISCVTACC